MRENARDEWGVIEKLLPVGWQDAARSTGAFRRIRYTSCPSDLLRLLLFHAVNDGGLRSTIEQARAAGITSISPVALHKRLKTSAAWLEWIAVQLCREYREEPRLSRSLRPRVIDSTTLRAPGSKGTDWRLHYMLDLASLACDWHEVTDDSGSEALERAPVQAGDVILGDRNFFRPSSVHAMQSHGAHVVVRMRWCHGKMTRLNGRPFHALPAARRVRVGRTVGWPVLLHAPGHKEMVEGRVIATRLPAPLAQKAKKRLRRIASRKGKHLREQSIEATHFIWVFTTLPEELLDATGVLELYRYRWQVEVAFKRLKQLLKLGRVPHKDHDAAHSWIHAKLVVALVLEKLYRSARSFSPWGYRIDVTPETAEKAPT